ncbi:MAG: HAMP domain-containing histidine kinase [Chloroflexi bacterium]|nr:HAMP domain-containing histidine kinase [Chloroflexota bacterium]
MSIRLRLALWYTSVLVAVLVVFSSVLYLVMDVRLVNEADDAVAARAHHIAGAIRARPSASSGILHIELPSIDAFESPGVYVQVVEAPTRSVVARSASLGEQELPGKEEAYAAVARSGMGSFYTGLVGDRRVRVYVQPLYVGEEIVGLVQVGQSYSEAYAFLDRLRLALLMTGVAAASLAGAVAWAVAGGALKPIAAITQTARAIALSRGFSRRLEDTGSRDELGQLGVTFNEMLASLEEAYAAQQRFLADASHELRAPLTAVQANLELLDKRGDELPEEERKALLGAASAEARRMGRLVHDLLSLARADAGQKLMLRPTQLDRLLLEVFGEARVLARGIKVSIEDIDEVSLLADPDRIKQLILILVDNAIRYTPSGEVRLSLHKNGAMATVKVADTGIGIAKGDIPHIFERFYRTKEGRAHSSAGTGLGLAVAKWIVEQHGGEIAVESTLGKGSVLTVLLPLDRGQGGTRSVASA